MSGGEAVGLVTAEWVRKAESDLKAAAELLKIGAECPTDVIPPSSVVCLPSLFLHCSIRGSRG